MSRYPERSFSFGMMAGVLLALQLGQTQLNAAEAQPPPAAAAPSLTEVLVNIYKAAESERVAKIPALEIRGISTEAAVSSSSVHCR